MYCHVIKYLDLSSFLSKRWIGITRLKVNDHTSVKFLSLLFLHISDSVKFLSSLQLIKIVVLNDAYIETHFLDGIHHYSNTNMRANITDRLIWKK